MGERLFVRARTGVSLTEAGHKLLSNAETLLHINDEIYREFGMTPPAQRVRIGLPMKYRWSAAHHPISQRLLRPVTLILPCSKSPRMPPVESVSRSTALYGLAAQIVKRPLSDRYPFH